MWIVKGVFFGAVIFIVGGVLCTVIRVRFVMHRLAQTYKTDTMFVGFKVGALLHDPFIWGALFVSLALGIWIVRARMHGMT